MEGGGRGSQDGGDTCTPMADSCHTLFSLKHKRHGPQQITLFSRDLSLAFLFPSLGLFFWEGNKINWSSVTLKFM